MRKSAQWEDGMSAADLRSLAPLIIIACSAVGLMAVVAFYRSHSVAAVLCIAGLGSALFAIGARNGGAAVGIGSLLVMDGPALYYMGLICLAGMAVAGLSYNYLGGRREDPEEFYLLLLLAVLGGMVLAGSSHFITFFIGLEVLSVSLYGLIAYTSQSGRGIEAGIKYLILAAVASSFLLFGMAIIYAKTGAMGFGEAVKALAGGSPDLFVLAGTGLIIIGIGFKLGLVPFHLWTPDVYQGAPAPVSAFIATASKGAVISLLIRYLGPYVSLQQDTVFMIFAVLSVASMVVGNVLALLQDDLKRILAYSSIAHMGYLMVAFLAGGQAAAGFYIAAYFVTTLGAFGVVTVMSGKSSDAGPMGDFAGLATRSPWLAGILGVMLLSLAGMPFTAGFVGKLYLIRAGAGASLWVLIVALALNSVLGLFYYLRVVAALFGEGPEAASAPVVAWHDRIVIGALVVGLLWMGINPAPFIGFIEVAMAVVG